MEKDDDTVDEAAYNATFDEFTPRLDDIIKELYHQNEMEEKDEKQPSLHSWKEKSIVLFAVSVNIH